MHIGWGGSTEGGVEEDGRVWGGRARESSSKTATHRADELTLAVD